jgi:uncharacterized membrane protein YdfJ with MMPL/SSD domain
VRPSASSLAAAHAGGGGDANGAAARRRSGDGEVELSLVGDERPEAFSPPTPAEPARARTGEERARVALLHAGSSVLCGAGSTMCGFVALAFAQTHTFQVFFRMTFATVALALLHALLVFPALLAWFGPSEKEE